MSRNPGTRRSLSRHRFWTRPFKAALERASASKAPEEVCAPLVVGLMVGTGGIILCPLAQTANIAVVRWYERLMLIQPPKPYAFYSPFTPTIYHQGHD